MYVVPGGGDDVVDATAYPGDSMETSLGQRQADGSSGDDTYLGGGQTDIVFVSAGVAADHKDIHLDGGEDQLYVDSNYRGAATAKLGVGADYYWTERPRPGVRVNAEEGRDHFVSQVRRVPGPRGPPRHRRDQGQRLAGRLCGSFRGH